MIIQDRYLCASIALSRQEERSVSISLHDHAHVLNLSVGVWISRKWLIVHYLKYLNDRPIRSASLSPDVRE